MKISSLDAERAIDAGVAMRHAPKTGPNWIATCPKMNSRDMSTVSVRLHFVCDRATAFFMADQIEMSVLP